MKKIIFLGGTCGQNNWRVDFINHLKTQGVPDDLLFNPVVSDWNEEAQRREDEAKEKATYMLYLLANPKEEGNSVSFYSLLEATMGLYDAPERTVVVFDTTDMPKHAEKASKKAFSDLKKRFPNSPIFGSLYEAEEWLVKMSK